MTPPIEKLIALERNLAEERGEFEFFGVFLREASLGKWDLLVAAPWLKTGDRESLVLIVGGMQKTLSSHELLEFSRVVVLDKGNPYLEGLLGMFSVGTSALEVHDLELLDLSIERGFIITARRRLVHKRRRNRDGGSVK